MHKGTPGFKPMLAATVEDVAALRFPLMASPKLDGVRALVMGGVVYSRNLKPIPNKHVQKLFGSSKLDGLDGELIVGDPCAPEAFRATTSGIMSVDGEPDVLFHAFDDTAVFNTPFVARYSGLFAKMVGLLKGTVEPVHHTTLESRNELEDYEALMLVRGYEGVMLRDPNGPYKFGRSTLKEGWLMKLKRFADSEAVVLGVYEQEHNANVATKDELGRTKRSSHKAGKVAKGTLGGLHVRDLKTGVEFDIGTGFDDALRAELWANHPIGQVVKYKFFPTGSKERPRFPVFIGFRAPIDL